MDLCHPYDLVILPAGNHTSGASSATVSIRVQSTPWQEATVLWSLPMKGCLGTLGTAASFGCATGTFGTAGTIGTYNPWYKNREEEDDWSKDED